MNVIKTKIRGVLIIEPKVFGDCRGYIPKGLAHGFAVLCETVLF